MIFASDRQCHAECNKVAQHKLYLTYLMHLLKGYSSLKLHKYFNLMKNMHSPQ